MHQKNLKNSPLVFVQEHQIAKDHQITGQHEKSIALNAVKQGDPRHGRWVAGGLVACWWLVRQCLLCFNIHFETTSLQWIEIKNL